MGPLASKAAERIMRKTNSEQMLLCESFLGANFMEGLSSSLYGYRQTQHMAPK